uniref:Nudix (nucleoside diphosphate linked moiety X)-type motif 13 n=1 Tax=Mastacembelus armatus TaxID=205130 RepID=A0A3Q3M4H0_9TELE
MLRPLRNLLSATKCLPSRCCSGFIAVPTRYLNRLKEDDEACVAALQNSHIFLFHRLSPLLQRTNLLHVLILLMFDVPDVQLILERLGSDTSLLNESVLISCSEQSQAQFCLDVGELDQAAVEEECGGNFIDLKKSLFLLTVAEAPLVAKGQALLRWHQTNRFCSSTGQPTRRNQAGSQRVCSSNGIVYYPKMSPVVIVLVSDGKCCLLGRQASFPRGMYSALAGFCDMGQTQLLIRCLLT